MFKKLAFFYLLGYGLSAALTISVLWTIGMADTGIGWLFSPPIMGGEIVKNILVILAIYIVSNIKDYAVGPKGIFFVGIFFGGTFLGFFKIATAINSAALRLGYFHEISWYSEWGLFIFKQMTYGLLQVFVVVSGVFVVALFSKRF
jgi:hypothetical protein